jgi:hypothetical protein
MMYKAKVAVCAEIRTKHSTRSEHRVEFFNINLVIHKETARLKRVNVRHRFVKTKERMNTMGQAVGNASMSPTPSPQLCLIAYGQ